jgi:hypothetical protein
MKEAQEATQQAIEKEIRQKAPSSAIGYRLMDISKGSTYPKDGKNYYNLASFEWPIFVPVGLYQLLFIDQGGKPIFAGRSASVRIDPLKDEREAAETRGHSDDDHDDSQSEDDGDSESNDGAVLYTDIDDAVLESAKIENKRKRHKINSRIGKTKYIADHYELFDTMKSDMMRQILSLSKISQQHHEIQLSITQRMKSDLEKSAPPVVEDKANWSLVAAEALRTISELGKTAMSSRVQLLAEATRPALAAPSAESSKLSEKTAEEIAKKAAEEVAKKAAEEAKRAAEEAARKTAEEVAERNERKLERLERMLAAMLDAFKPIAAAAQASTSAAQASTSTAQASTAAAQAEARQGTDENSDDDEPRDPPGAAASGEPTARTSQPSDGIAARTASEEAPAQASAPTETTQTSQPAAIVVSPSSQNPYVKSWRSIKSFFRRMTDMDLLLFTSSGEMFRVFLAMLRALTPYYQGPSVSMEELTRMGAVPC